MKKIIVLAFIVLSASTYAQQYKGNPNNAPLNNRKKVETVEKEAELKQELREAERMAKEDSVAKATLVVHAIPSFEGTLDQALSQAKKQGKTVVLEFGASWCLPCKQMEKITFRDPRVIDAFEEKYIMYRVDMDKFSGMDIGDKYKVKALPAILFLDKKGGVNKRLIGFQNAEQLLAEQ